MALSDFSKLYKLLGRPIRAKFMRGDGDGATYSAESEIGRADFLDHVHDRACLALSPLNGRGEAVFLAIDLDARFYQRLEVIERVLQRRGLAQAAFGVSGSAPWRGKVIVTLADPMPQEHACDLLSEIIREAKSNPRFGQSSEASELSVFPQDGQGGHVRILGRSRKRVGFGRLEALLDLDGAPLYSVDAIEPVRNESGVRTLKPSRKRIPEFVRRIVSGPYSRRGDEVFSDMLRLAQAAVNCYGERAETKLVEWCEETVRNSPGISSGARAQLLRRDARSRALRLVSETRAKAGATAWKPLEAHLIQPWGSKVRVDKACAAYAALAAYIIENRLDAHAFGATYARIRDLGGFHSKRSAQRAIHDARDAGLVAILDTGEPRKRGLCSLFTLRGGDETLADAIRKGIESDPFQKRIADRKARGLGPPAIFATYAVQALAA